MEAELFSLYIGDHTYCTYKGPGYGWANRMNEEACVACECLHSVKIRYDFLIEIIIGNQVGKQ